MVFIPDPDTDPTTPADAVRVPEFYPRTDDRAPFNHRDNVRIRTDESFEKYYEIYGEPLGEGKFGKVYECRERSSGLVLAAKFIKIRKDPDRKTVEREVSIMTQMRHPRIAQIYDAFWQGKNDVILVMEIVRGGELFNRVAEETYVLTEKAVAAVICQLCEAIDYMHSQNIIHLDIKPENIMCVSETGNSIKLIDFGLAQLFDPSKDLYLMAGTPEFAAPEVIKYEPLEYRTDMWSVGVITYILLSGYSPFLGDTTPETYVNVERGEWAFTEEFDFVSEPAKDFITRLLSYNKSERMLPSECLKHEWLAGVRSLVADEETLSSPAALAGPALAAAQLRRYVIRRRFRKIGLVVRTCVQLRLRMEASRSRSITPRVEASSSSSTTPPEVKDEAVVAPVEAASTTNASMADEISEALPTPTIKTTSPDEISSVGESGKLKKKKKPKTTISSETERPSEKKLKRAEASESSKENAAALAALLSASEAAAPSTTEAAADQKTKKRLKKEVSAAADTTASSTEMPAKMSKKAKSPSPTTNSESLRSPVPVIYEEGIKIDEPEKKKETTTVKKKKTKPVGSDSAVTLSEDVDKNRQPAKKEKPEEKLPSAKIAASPSGSLLTTPEAATPAAAKKSLSASAAPAEETRKTPAAEKASGSSSNLAVPSGSAGKIRAKSGSGSLIGARIQQLAVASEKPPSIVVQPPTPAGSAAGRRPLNGVGRIEAMKKRLWKQENVKEGKAEEVVVLPKGEQLTPLILPVFDASESLRKKNAAEKSASEKKSEVEPKTASRAPSSAKVIPVTEEKSSTTTTVTTTKVRRKKKEEDSGVVVESDSKHIEEAASKVIETAKISVSKVELKEETVDEKAKKTTVKKSVLNKTTTSTATQKQRTEGVDKADPNATVTSSLAQSQKSELSLSTKTKVDSVVEKDASIKLAKEIKKKLTVKSEPEPRSEEEKPRKTTSAVLAGKETVTVSKSDGKTTETLKKTTSLRTRMPSPSAEKSEREDSSPPNEDKLKKKKTVLKKMKSMPTEEKPFIEYPASLAEDIQKFKACRSKAKAREEEIQRHVRFALEEDMSKSAYVETASMRSARLERTISDGASSTSSSSDHTGGSLTLTKTRRRSSLGMNMNRTSYFEITEDEQETLAAGREDFSFSTLRERLERQLTKRGGSPSDDEEAAVAPRPKELIRCPSTNSLLKKWRTFEQAHA